MERRRVRRVESWVRILAEVIERDLMVEGQVVCQEKGEAEMMDDNLHGRSIFLRSGREVGRRDTNEAVPICFVLRFLGNQCSAKTYAHGPS